jgi:hypothetical protein
LQEIIGLLVCVEDDLYKLKHQFLFLSKCKLLVGMRANVVSHITNFNITPEILLLTPIIILPQLIMAVMWSSYTRLKYGFFYAILLHSLYNGIPILADIIMD